MDDVIFLVLTGLLFAATLGLGLLCGRLMERKS